MSIWQEDIAYPVCYTFRNYAVSSLREHEVADERAEFDSSTSDLFVSKKNSRLFAEFYYYVDIGIFHSL